MFGEYAAQSPEQDADGFVLVDQEVFDAETDHMLTGRSDHDGCRYPLAAEWAPVEITVAGCPSLGISTMLPKKALAQEKLSVRCLVWAHRSLQDAEIDSHRSLQYTEIDTHRSLQYAEIDSLRFEINSLKS